MRELKRIISNSNCNCSKKETFLELNFPLDFKHLPYFISLGYKEKKAYGNSGLFFIEDSTLIAIGPVGSNRLQIKCKKPQCLDSLDRLESLIKEMPDETEAKIP